MTVSEFGAIDQRIRIVVADKAKVGQSDGSLLRAYLDHRDQQAFEALLRRHGRMVLQVCTRSLGNAHDAEDAFQATFLVLARQAVSIRKRESLTSWLQGVAYRMAAHAKRAAVRRRGHESQAKASQAPDPALTAAWHELQLLLDEEIARLPEILREPFIACCLENKSCAEAARQMGVSDATVWKRLSRARRQLQERLSKRGVSLTAALAAAALSGDGILATVPRAMLNSTVKAASNVAAGHKLSSANVSASVISLVEGATRAMFLTKCKVGLILLAASILGGGYGLGALQALSAQPGVGQAEPTVQLATPKRQTLRREIVQAGSLEPYEDVPIYPKIAGFVQEVKVDTGDKIKKGELLAQLDVPEIEADILAKKARIGQGEADVILHKAMLQAAEANLATWEASVRVAEAGITRAQAVHERWNQEWQRDAELVKQKLLDQKALDETSKRLKAAEAARDEAKAELASTQASQNASIATCDKAKADVQASEAQLAVSKREYQELLDWFDCTKITAPCDGTVTSRNIRTGHFVQPANVGTTPKVSEPLFIITRTDKMRVVLTIPEPDAFLIKQGAEAIVRLPALKDREIACKIDRTSWILDGKTHQLRVEIFLDNPKDELRSGMPAKISILEKVSDIMTLPVDAILTDGAVKYCFLVENGKATRRHVKVGTVNKGQIEILAKQLPPAKPGQEGAWVKLTGTERALIFDLHSIEEAKKSK